MKKKVIVKESKIHGKGAFANKDFKKEETVIKWDLSVKLTKEAADRLPKKEKHYVYCTEKSEYFLLHSPERFVNHSCNPNTNVKNHCDVAIRDIKKGEEITGDYSKEDLLESNMECNCGNNNCKGMIKTRTKPI